MLEYITKTLLSPIKNLTEQIGEEFQELVVNKTVEYVAEEYNRNIFIKTILHRHKPVDIRKIYLPLSIEVSNEETISKASISDIFNISQFVTVIGEAGSGKSMFVRHLIVQTVNTGKYFPIKIELRYLNDYNGSFYEFVINEILKFHELAENEKIINRFLHTGSLVFLLDGFDELKSLVKSKITKGITEFTKRFNRNKYIITTRPYANGEYIPLFHNCEILPLSNHQINEFIKRQQIEEEISERIVRSIDRKENRDYINFLRNPLFLSMFIMTFQSYSNIPQKKSSFYRQVFEILFSRHDSESKLGFSREMKSDLDKDDFIKVLRPFCYISFFENKIIFLEDYLFQNLNTIKNKLNFTFSNDSILYDLLVSVSLLIQDGLYFTFPHRSMQEYFAASFLKNLDSKHKKIAYGKMKQALIRESKINYKNLYDLCLELDTIEFTKFLIIPFLEEMIKEFKKQDPVKLTDTILDNVISADSSNIGLLDAILDNYIYKCWTKVQYTLLSPDDEYFNNLEFIAELVKVIKKKIKALKDEIDREEGGNLDIIELI